MVLTKGWEGEVREKGRYGSKSTTSSYKMNKF